METTYKFLKLLVWVLSFALVIVSAFVLYDTLTTRMDASMQAEPVQPAPTAAPAPTVPAETQPLPTAADFTFYDQDGNACKLSDLQGKPVFLNFWASWCGPCKMEMPAIQSAYDTYGDQIHFVILNRTDGSLETVESASSYISSQGYTFPVFYDTAQEGEAAYQVNSFPRSYFINAEGQLTGQYFGTISYAKLSAELDKLIP